MPTGELGRSDDAKAEETALVLNCTAFLLRGDLDAVERLCGRAAVLQPADSMPHKLMGAAFLLEKRYAGAHDEFTEAVRLAPRDAGGHIGLGEALRGEGDFDGSIRAFTVALKLTPNDAGAWNARCWVRGLFARQTREGLVDCNKALALWPKNANFLDSRGLIYLRLGQTRKAIRNYNQAIAIVPDLPTALYGRGVSEFRLGRLQNGVKDIALARSFDAKVDDVFAEAPLLSSACRMALFTASAHAACTAKPGGQKTKSPLSSRSVTMESGLRRGALALAESRHRPYADEKDPGRSR